ncbi:hypothetical protein AYI68_g7247, partial [Smittium mucronatum]
MKLILVLFAAISCYVEAQTGDQKFDLNPFGALS